MEISQHLVKRCRICGDKASGFNYNALCCESCKVFFLRNASNNKLTCCFTGNCEINIFTRKNCAKCRLNKCLAYEMVLKFNKIENFELKSGPDLHIRSILMQDHNEAYEHINLEYINPFYLNLPQLSSYQLTHKRKYASELIAPERQVIAQIQTLLGETFVDETRLRVAGMVSNVAGTFQHVAMYARNIVKFCKSIPAFKQLCPSDQLIILKSFYYEILVTRLVYMYDLVNEGYPIIENESADQALFIKLDIGLEFKNQKLIQGLKFQIELHDELENDFTIRDLFIAILLFKSRANLSNPEFVHYQYSLYCRVLRHYLEHKYRNVGKAERKYKTLIRFSDAFDHQMQLSRCFVQSEFDKQQIPQVIIEFLDL